MGYKGGYRKKAGLEYKKYRVRGNIRSFRDLEVYKKTTEYASKIFSFELPGNLKGRGKIEDELEKAYGIAKFIPRMIAQAYGDRFTDKGLAYGKLEKAAQLVSDAIAKLDFLISSVEHQKTKEEFVDLIKKYQRQRMKILNLKKAWMRWEEKKQKYENKD